MDLEVSNGLRFLGIIVYIELIFAFIPSLFSLHSRDIATIERHEEFLLSIVAIYNIQKSGYINNPL